MILLTGAAGFIGAYTARRLARDGHEVLGIDNLNDYYDVRIKNWRLEQLSKVPGFRFEQVDIEDFEHLSRIFEANRFDAVINLAARAGVRYSMENPFIYMTTNADGNLNLLELCRRHDVGKFVLASTSSLYAGQPMPFTETLAVNTPISPYAASKKAAEAMCYSYHYLYGIDVSVVRYFTVYGPAGRPDMSVYRFIKWINEGTDLEVFGDGTQTRDFTFVEDIADGTVRALKPLGFEVINLGNNSPDELNAMISRIEECLGKKSGRITREFHKADLKATWADISKAGKLLDWQPEVPMTEGIKRTVDWTLENWSWLKDIEI